jgi:hypothetical protein
MMEISIFAAVGMMVAFVMLKGYTTKGLGQLRHECGSLMVEERRLRSEREQEEILVESAEAKRNQAQFEVQKFTEEQEDLGAMVTQLDEELGRGPVEEEE